MSGDEHHPERKSVKVGLVNWRYLMQRAMKENKTVDEIITELRVQAK